jgi:hypothetical protein
VLVLVFSQDQATKSPPLHFLFKFPNNGRSPQRNE